MACHTTPPAAPPAPPPVAASAAPPVAPAASAPAPRPALAAEQRRLSALFRGTPVVFSMQADGSLRVAVPLRFCFDAGKSAVKPPLAAVLDRIALSQQDGSSRLAIAAAADSIAKPAKPAKPAEPAKAATPVSATASAAASKRRETLATRRAASVRDYLVNKGLGETRLTSSIATPGAGLTLLIKDAPAAASTAP